jgi:hypothetical protein
MNGAALLYHQYFWVGCHCIGDGEEKETINYGPTYKTRKEQRNT